MKTITLHTAGLLLLLGILPACKKDKAPGFSVEEVTVTRVSRTIAQAGDTLTIYGSHLVQQNILTEIFISDRPATIIKQSTDSIGILVPAKARTGKLIISLSSGKQFSSVEGPQIEVRPTPLIMSYWPVYAYGGETIELRTENFSTNDADNHIFIGDLPVTIVSRKGKDTLMVKLPANAVTGVISWDTYRGPSFKMASSYRVRQHNYTANTVAEWLSHDPAFTYMDTLVKGYPVLAGGNFGQYYKRVYDSAMSYMQAANRTYTIFLPHDGYFIKNGLSRENYIDGIKARPYNYNTMLLAAVVPDHNLQLASLHDGDRFDTRYSMLMQWYPDGTDTDRNYFVIVEQNGEKYAQIYGMYNESRTPVKILREHHIGNATIIEIDGEPGYVPF